MTATWRDCAKGLGLCNRLSEPVGGFALICGADQGEMRESLRKVSQGLTAMDARKPAGRPAGKHKMRTAARTPLQNASALY